MGLLYKNQNHLFLNLFQWMTFVLIFDIKRAMYYVRSNFIRTRVMEKHVETACVVPGYNNVANGRHMASIKCDIISSR